MGCDTFTISVPECNVSPVLSLVLPPFSSPQMSLAGEDEEITWCKRRKEKIWLENGGSSSGQGVFKKGGREEEKE